jgi:hypothetical protein
MKKSATAAVAAVGLAAITSCIPIVHVPPKKVPPKPMPVVGAQLGVVSGAERMHVQLVQVQDPSPVEAFSSVPANARFVALKFTLSNVGTVVASGDVYNDAVLVGSNHQTYTPIFDEVQGCTSFNYGTYRLARGASSTGCIGFSVPAGVKVTKVQYSLFDSNTAEWTVR